MIIQQKIKDNIEEEEEEEKRIKQLNLEEEEKRIKQLNLEEEERKKIEDEKEKEMIIQLKLEEEKMMKKNEEEKIKIKELHSEYINNYIKLEEMLNDKYRSIDEIYNRILDKYNEFLDKEKLSEFYKDTVKQKDLEYEFIKNIKEHFIKIFPILLKYENINEDKMKKILNDNEIEFFNISNYKDKFLEDIKVYLDLESKYKELNKKEKKRKILIFDIRTYIKESLERVKKQQIELNTIFRSYYDYMEESKDKDEFKMIKNTTEGSYNITIFNRNEEFNGLEKIDNLKYLNDLLEKVKEYEKDDNKVFEYFKLRIIEWYNDYLIGLDYERSKQSQDEKTKKEYNDLVGEMKKPEGDEFNKKGIPLIKETNMYKILGVEDDASKKEIKNAYRKLILIHHPDKPTGRAENFVLLEEAYKRAYNLASETKKNKKTTFSPYSPNIDFANNINTIKTQYLNKEINNLYIKYFNLMDEMAFNKGRYSKASNIEMTKKGGYIEISKKAILSIYPKMKFQIDNSLSYNLINLSEDIKIADYLLSLNDDIKDYFNNNQLDTLFKEYLEFKKKNINKKEIYTNTFLEFFQKDYILKRSDKVYLPSQIDYYTLKNKINSSGTFYNVKFRNILKQL